MTSEKKLALLFSLNASIERWAEENDFDFIIGGSVPFFMAKAAFAALEAISDTHDYLEAEGYMKDEDQS